MKAHCKIFTVGHRIIAFADRVEPNRRLHLGLKHSTLCKVVNAVYSIINFRCSVKLNRFLCNSLWTFLFRLNSNKMRLKK